VSILSTVAKTVLPGWVLPVVIGGAIILAVAGIFRAGMNYANIKCDAAAVRLKLERAEQLVAEKDRQITAINGIQQRDAARALTAEQRARELEDEKLSATPANPTVCFDGGAADRVRKTR
jgi:hypothetical protein